ncbi:hypothetical protein Pelo_3727 [Pelomyxa schiedti]|nr:hypothetical protein Pelo_3727 [Pelomyxa schiedti]
METEVEVVAVPYPASELWEDVRGNARSGGGTSAGWVCQEGHTETAKWVVERFRITELWEAVEPLIVALSHGNLGVAQWLYDEFPGCGELMQRVGVDATPAMIHGVEGIEWAMERFPRCFGNEHPRDIIPMVCACTLRSHDDPEILRLCKWLKEKFSLNVDIRYLNNIAVLKWAVSVFNIELTTETVFSMSAKFNPDFIRWVVTEKNISPTAELVMETCARDSATVSHVKWLMERTPPLTRKQLQKSLLGALEYNNLEVAVWLDDSFHLMEEINADSKSLVPSFFQVCKSPIGIRGTKWFLQHISSFHMIPESSVVQVIKESLNFELISLLLETFHLNTSLPKYKWTEPEVSRHLRTALLRGIPTIKQCISWLGEDVMSQDFVAQLLTGAKQMWVVGLSSKVVKWFIVHYALGSEQVKSNNNLVLFTLLSRGKNHCAEWIIKNFCVTFPEVAKMMKKWGGTIHFRVDLRTWQLLHRNFPSLTPDVVRDHLMDLALSSPVTAKFVLLTFPPITKAELRDHVLRRVTHFSDETRLWLDVEHRD